MACKLFGPPKWRALKWLDKLDYYGLVKRSQKRKKGRKNGNNVGKKVLKIE